MRRRFHALVLVVVLVSIAAPANARAKRRVDAEKVLRAWARRSGSCLAILRAPGIYAADRLPLERLHKGTPALAAGGSSSTRIP